MWDTSSPGLGRCEYENWVNRSRMALLACKKESRLRTAGKGVQTAPEEARSRLWALCIYTVSGANTTINTIQTSIGLPISADY